MISFNHPFKFCSNRVWRTYTGGKILEQWNGAYKAEDGNLPEEWIGSVTKAKNPGREHIQYEGYSFVKLDEDKSLLLTELIKIDPEKILGLEHFAQFGMNTGLLVKMLDSAERLTIQVHPDLAAANRFFQSSFGKTEAWYIVDKREDMEEEPYILFGFKPGITKEKWIELFNKQDIEGMEKALHKIYVEPGQVYLVEGGIPHAIGPGCFILEIQEPTDYTIRVEKETPKGFVIPDSLCHQGIGFERMFDCFHYDSLEEEEVINRWRLKPIVIKNQNGFVERDLIGYEDTPHFHMVSVEISSEYDLEPSTSYSIVVILSGNGEMFWKYGSVKIQKGDSYFVPACTTKVSINSSLIGTITLVRCFPPQPSNSRVCQYTYLSV